MIDMGKKVQLVGDKIIIESVLFTVNNQELLMTTPSSFPQLQH